VNVQTGQLNYIPPDAEAAFPSVAKPGQVRGIARILSCLYNHWCDALGFSGHTVLT
jgi:hypothetical protein